jgi:2-isopropylmalate synthase
VAAAELALLAGADRVEGTLFGNGERTGNVDLVTLALNLYTQGVAPGLDFSDIDDVIESVEFCNRIPVHDRHPYAGQMVFTAFSGSHQDAIKKGFAATPADGLWAVPYLPIDPKDLGRSYEAVIRVNSQSGKGGVAYLLERDRGIRLPRRLQIEFSQMVQKVSDSRGGEVTSSEIWQAFNAEYIDRSTPFTHHGHQDDSSGETNRLTATVSRNGVPHILAGEGNGPIEAFIDGFQREFGLNVRIANYEEHAIGDGANARAICYVQTQMADAPLVFGVGMHGDIVSASLNAIVSAVNRSLQGTGSRE